MPNQPKRHCTYPGCATLVLKGRCSKHPYPASKKKRPGSTAQGYGVEWRRRRARYLRTHPFCEIQRKCRGDRARHVDHIDPKRPTGRESDDELQAACVRCHSWKTATHDMQRTEGGQFK